MRDALGGFPEASELLQSLATRGLQRIDEATLWRRAGLMTVLLSRLGDRPCVCLHGAPSPTDAEKREIERAMVNLGSGFVSEWMRVLHAQILAEVRKSPVREVTDEDLAAAYSALQTSIGADAAQRVAAGLEVDASDSERCRALKRIYKVAPRLPAPHGTLVLRLIMRGG